MSTKEQWYGKAIRDKTLEYANQYLLNSNKKDKYSIEERWSQSSDGDESNRAAAKYYTTFFRKFRSYTLLRL